MDIEALRLLTQSTDKKKLQENTAAMLEVLMLAKDEPANTPARWATFMIGLSAACIIEGWIAFGEEAESEELIKEFDSFCNRAWAGSWFVNDAQLVEMMDKVLILERARLAEDGWEPETFDRSTLYLYRDLAFRGDAIHETGIYQLPVTPEA